MEKEDKKKHTNEDDAKSGFYCINCNNYIDKNEFERSLNVCSKCGYHYRINSNERVITIFDKDSIEYMDTGMGCEDITGFPGYSQKLSKYTKELKMNSAVITGKGRIYDNLVYFGIMDYRFLMGTLGIIEGEKLTRMIEKATDDTLPIVIFAASGGARIQEGTLALYQMMKIAAAIKKHSNKGLLFISVLTDPTFGGVNASFASVGDIVIAEPNANIGFAGKSVIMQTTEQQFPDNFQTAEFLFEHGFIDIIVNRRSQKLFLYNLLKIHKINYNSNRNIGIKLQKNADKIKMESGNEITSWQRVQISRSYRRLRSKAYINNMISGFIELHGDMAYKDDKAMMCGLGYLEDLPLTIISNARGNEIYENIERNFGMSYPEGYRKALRLMKQAEKFNRPILCLVDTPGAFCGIEAEERGQSRMIATCLMEMSDISVPIITIIHGEGGSGGALAISIGDYTYMFENAVYSVISPEGAAAIVLKDPNRATEISDSLKLTAKDLLSFGIIDEIIMEPKDKTRNSIEYVMNELKDTIYIRYKELLRIDKKELVKRRYRKIRSAAIV